MTEANWYMYTLIYKFTGPATNHCPKNGLSHLWIMECLNVHIISLELITHYFFYNWVACRGLAVKEWNHGVDGGVGVVRLIGQYFGLGYFDTARWPRKHCHCPRNPVGRPVFPFTILFAVFTVSSARLLDWGYVTEDSLCLTHCVSRNSWNMLEVKGGLLSVLSLSQAPYDWNSYWQMDINLDEVAWPGSSWYKMSQSICLCRQGTHDPNIEEIHVNGQSGDHVKMICSHSLLGAMFGHTMKFALILQIEASIAGQYTN